MEPEITEDARRTLGFARHEVARRASLHEGETVFFIGWGTNFWDGLEVFYLTTHRIIGFVSKKIVFSTTYEAISRFEREERKSGFTIHGEGKPFSLLRLPTNDYFALQAALETLGVHGAGRESWQMWVARRTELQSAHDSEVQRVAAHDAAKQREKAEAERAAAAKETALKAKSRGYTWPNSRTPNGRPNSTTSLSILRACRENEEPWLLLTESTSGTLAAFDDRLMIIKKGVVQSYMAGSFGGERATTFYFTDINAVEYNSGFLSGVLEVLTASYQGTANKDYWRGTTKSRNADSNDPFTLSNTLPFQKTSYHQARADINELQERISRAKRPASMSTAPAPAPTDLVAQLAQLGQLRDSGVLSPEEFAAAKARILGGPSA